MGLIKKYQEKNSSFKIKFEYFQKVTDIRADKYDGAYTVVPKAEAQVLPTKKKYLEDNVTVTEIPYFDVTNPAGGQTIYIGSEVEINGQ